jgi:UPF0755 protein
MKKKIFIFLIFLTAIFLLFGFFWQGIYLPKEKNSKEYLIFRINRGEGVKEIAQNLEKEKLIKGSWFFVVYNFFTCNTPKLQAGTYLLSPSMNIPEIVEKFVKGDVVKEKITILEGWTIEDIADYLEEKGIVNKEDFLKATRKDFSDEFEFLREKPKNSSLEGYLFPDTYEVKLGESSEEIIKKMLKNFDSKLTPNLREEIKRQNKTIFEILILASLLEKEVKTKEDKELVAGILWKRLENKMPLQVDATITYITGKKTTKISKEETQIDNPYNTYKYLGLPPGPICNPGLESILAAIYPKESDYWYYLSTPDGKTIFSKTLQEHNLAKEKYLK